MSISIDFHRVAKAEMNTYPDSVNPFSAVRIEDKGGVSLTFYVADDPGHMQRAEYLAGAFKYAFGLEGQEILPEIEKAIEAAGQV